MYTKMRIFILSVGFGLCGNLAGMEQQEAIALQQLVKQGIICGLHIDDYIVPVKNIYQALKKEAGIYVDSLEQQKQMFGLQIKEINNKKRLQLRQLNIPVYSIDFSDIRGPFKHNFRNFLTKEMNVIFYRHSPPFFKNPTGYMMVNSCLLLTSESSIDLVEVHKFEYSAQDIGAVVKNELIFFLKNRLGVLLNNQKKICIELWSEGNLSDWVRIQNLYDFDSQPIIARSRPLMAARQPVQNIVVKFADVEKPKIIMVPLVMVTVILGLFVIKELFCP